MAWKEAEQNVGGGVIDDLTNIVATGTTNNTGATIVNGTYFYLNDVLCKATKNIAINDAFTQNTNYTVITAGGLNAVKNIGTSFLHSNESAANVNANTPFRNFTIPQGNWMLFINVPYSAVSTWLHLKNTSSGAEYSVLLVGAGYSASEVAFVNVNADTPVAFYSDVRFSNQNLRTKVRGIRLS